MESNLRFEWHPGRVVVAGDIDLSTAAQLQQTLAGLEGAAILVDLGKVDFIDSSGIHVLVEARAAHPNVRVVNPTPTARRVFEIAGVVDLLMASQDGAGDPTRAQRTDAP